MDIRKILCSQTLGAFIVAMCLLSSMPVGASIKHKLSGNSESSTDGSGFWSGHFPSDTLSHVYNNRSNKFIGSSNHQNSISGWGIGWRSLSMTLGKRGNHSGFASTGGGGGGGSGGSGGSGGGNFKIPHIEHPLVSELHYDGSTGLTFETWHKDPQTNTWHDYDDTNVLHEVKHSQIPEPTSLLLLSLGLYAIVATKKKCVVKLKRV